MRSIAGLLLALALVAQTAAADRGLPKVRIAPDGRTFQTAEGKRFIPFGVNYYRPGTGWAPQLWKQFDAEATRRDFARLRELGVTCVRVFLSYGSFFTERDALNPEGLAKFDQFLAIAEQAGIYVHPTGPDHWEGKPNWYPPDRYADDESLSALEGYWKRFAGRYRARGVIFAYDLLNEPSVAWDTPVMRAKWNAWLKSHYGSAEKTAQTWAVPPQQIAWGKQGPPSAKDARGTRRLLDYQHFREEIADEWTRRQSRAIKAADPQALVTVGFIQWSVPATASGVQQYAAFRPSRQAPFLDFLEIHFYPLARGMFQYDQEDEQRNLAYLESVVRETAAPGKPVVVAEFGWYGGGSITTRGRLSRPATEEDQARWCRRAVETTENMACGWLNWGFYDHPQARDVSQLTGLLTVDGKPKPKAWAREFQTLARRLASRGTVVRQLGPRPTLNWDRAIVDPQAAKQFMDDYYQAFVRPASTQ